MAYVDGFVLPVPTAKLAAYKKMAKQGAKMWKEFGALEYYECIADDMNAPMGMPFPKAFKVKPNETVVFSWIIYKSKAHRTAVNKKMMSDPAMANFEMPFDVKRMVYGGFKPIVSF
jgi:uncharacterized protein YbaA (DUF1428 family)